MTFLKPLISESDALRQAFQWLTEQGHCTLKTVETASLWFDLTPRDEEFLLQQFVHHQGVARAIPDSGEQRVSHQPSSKVD